MKFFNHLCECHYFFKYWSKQILLKLVVDKRLVNRIVVLLVDSYMRGIYCRTREFHLESCILPADCCLLTSVV
jgi:hypothetical protein